MMSLYLKSRLSAFLRFPWIYALYVTGLLWWSKRYIRCRGAVAVLGFHRVLSNSDFNKTNCEPEVLVRKATFEEFVRYATSHYEIIDLCCEPEWHGRGGKLRVAFTFDDGWADNAAIVFPISRRYSIPVTIFVCPRLVGQLSPFWPERVRRLLRAAKVSEFEANAVVGRLKTCTPAERDHYISQLRENVGINLSSAFETVDATMSWAEIEELAQAGVTFGSHTQSHEILTQLCCDVARAELLDSKREIEKRLGRQCRLFAYPNGNWSAESRGWVVEAGYKVAFTTKQGVWTRNTDLMAVPRLNIAEENLIGIAGRFSPVTLEYSIFWKAYVSLKRNRGRIKAPRRLGRPEQIETLALGSCAERRIRSVRERDSFS